MNGFFSSIGRKGLFLIDPEKAHGLSIAALKSGFLPTCMVPHDPSLQQTVAGIVFPNPLGMAAGYDKNAEVPGPLLRLGFGFTEIGTVTPRGQIGNPKPRIFRLVEDEGIINIPLGRLNAERGWWQKPDPDGQPALTNWTVLGRGDGLTWLALEPVTGRTHQLRVHCAASGWPIVGDNIYGNGPRFGEPSLHLHAREIVIPLSKNKPPVRVVAPAPSHLHERLKACGWNGE